VWFPTPSLLCWGYISQTFCPGWPGTMILLNSGSCIAGMTGMGNSTQILVEMRSC
jgi:hypothetical protein